MIQVQVMEQDGIDGDGDGQEMMIKCSNLEKNPIEMVGVANVWGRFVRAQLWFCFRSGCDLHYNGTIKTKLSTL